MPLSAGESREDELRIALIVERWLYRKWPESLRYGWIPATDAVDGRGRSARALIVVAGGADVLKDMTV